MPSVMCSSASYALKLWRNLKAYAVYILVANKRESHRLQSQQQKFIRPMAPPSRVVSAPGKVLITGAYLILDRPHAGLVLSTSARFYTILKPLIEEIPPESWSWSWTDVKVVSPQLNKETTYKLSLSKCSLQNTSSDSGNVFVEQAIQLGVAAAKTIVANDVTKWGNLQKMLLHGLEITILGDNEFYSFRKQVEVEGLPLTSHSLASLPPFSAITRNSAENNGHDKALAPEVAKTGLGSSAAMTTATVACIMAYLGVVNLPPRDLESENVKYDERSLFIVHSMAQAAHCSAQGKVGSGFDVSSAVFGSQRYVRFSPSVLSSVQALGNLLPLVEGVPLILNGNWDYERKEYSLPPSLHLILGEPGFGGCHTPSMVGAVLSWRKREVERSERAWRDLAEANTAVEEAFSHLKQLSSVANSAYIAVLETCSTCPAKQWEGQKWNSSSEKDVVKRLLELRHAFEKVRCMLRQVGEDAGVPIEPPFQTTLLDITMDLDGVIFAGVPGAGGFDAVFAITIGSSALASVEKEWSLRGVLALPVREDPQGVREEAADPRDICSNLISLRI